MKIKHVDHIGINVEDLETVQNFFTDLGFTVAGHAHMEGELVDNVTGLKGVKTEFVMLQSPDGQINLEVIKYLQPLDQEGLKPSLSHTLGIRHMAFQVEDLDSIVKSVLDKGYTLVGKIQNYENIWKLCYINGPEGIIVELAERL